jgi:ABC-type lipoprotein export system ATPase subunit
MSLFEAQALCKYYRAGHAAEVRAVDDVSLTIERGSFTALVGPSGSGKTTLLALLGALERPTRGRVHFDGKDLGRCSDAELARTRRRLGIIWQDFALIPSLSAGENVAYPLVPRGVGRAERLRLAGDVLARFGLADKSGVRARDLSGGEQQRVAIARALAGGPDVVLADEPTSNLDAASGQALLAALREEVARGRTVLLASHDPAVIGLATRVIELERGRVKAVREAGQSEAAPEGS